MTTQPVRLLTPELAQNAYDSKDYTRGAFTQLALQAVINGRTACARVMSEDECRAEFEAYWCPPDYDETPGFEVHKQFAWDAYLASRRAAGLVADMKHHPSCGTTYMEDCECEAMTQPPQTPAPDSIEKIADEMRDSAKFSADYPLRCDVKDWAERLLALPSAELEGLIASVPLPPKAITFDKGWELLDELQRIAVARAKEAKR